MIVPKKIEGIDFGHLYRSATKTSSVGCDFYDLFELDDDGVGIVIGDEKLLQVVNSAVQYQPKTLTRYIFDRVVDFTGDLSDDIALLAVSLSSTMHNKRQSIRSWSC